MNGNATAVSSVSSSRRDNVHDAESESESSSAASSSKESYLESSVLLKDSSVTDLYHRKYNNNSSASYQTNSHHLVREIYDPYLIQKGSSDRMHEVPLVQSTPSDDRITGKFTINRTGSKNDRVKQSKMHMKKTTGDSRMSIKEAPLERQHQGVPLGDSDIIDYNDDSNSMAVELSSVDSCAVNDFKGCDISMSQQKADPGSINTTNMVQDRSISNELSSSKSFVSTELVSEITPDHVHRSTLSIIPATTTTTSAVLSTSACNARWDIALDSPFSSAYAMNSYVMGINNKRETSSTPPLSLVPAPALFIAPSTLHRDAASSSSSLKGTQFMPLADASRASDWLQRSNQQQDQLIGGGFGRTMSNNGASHHGSSYHHHHHHHHVSNTSAIDSIFGLSASNVSKNCGPRDCGADSDHSVATSLFVEVASLDEHGSYTRYGAACEEDPDEATEGEQDLVRSWAQLGYDSDLTMRSYPHSVTYQSRKQRKYGSTSNEKMSPTDPDNSHELEEPSSVINEEEDRLNNAPNQNRKLRHRLRSIKPSSKEITVRGKRKRRSGFSTLTVAAAGGGGGGGGAPLNTANSTRSSKYRSMVDSELLIGVRKSVEFGPGSNEEQYRYIDCGGGSTSTSMDAVDVEDGYDGASERGRCEYETDYPVDDDMGSASDNELPLDADAAVIDIAPDNNNEGNNSLSDVLYLHSFDMPDSVYAFSIINNNNYNNNNNSSSNSNESSIRNPSSSCKHAGKKRK